MDNRQATEDMARIMSLLNGTQPPKNISKQNPQKLNESVDIPEPDTKQDMMKILEMFNSGTKTTSSKPVLTEEVKQKYDGASSLKIIVELYPGSRTRKLYHIEDSNKLIFENIFLYEIAHLLKDSIEGNSFKSKTELLKLNDEYNTHLKEASFYKEKVNRCIQLNETKARPVLEEKYKSAVKKANEIQVELQKGIKI